MFNPIAKIKSKRDRKKGLEELKKQIERKTRICYQYAYIAKRAEDIGDDFVLDAINECFQKHDRELYDLLAVLEMEKNY